MDNWKRIKLLETSLLVTTLDIVGAWRFTNPGPGHPGINTGRRRSDTPGSPGAVLNSVRTGGISAICD